MNDLIALITAHPGVAIAIGAVLGIVLTAIWHSIRRIERLVRTVGLMAIAGGSAAAGGGAAADSQSFAAVAQFVSNLVHLH